MFSLRLFGSPSIVGEDGALVGGPATQRHRLALLALLALSPERGVGRERLMSYLWPESDTEHARQLLNQAAYSLRKALGEEALLSHLSDLRLNPQMIGADVAEFEAALARGDHERAVGLYSAPLLDGFFLSDGPEFERWVDRERARLAGAYGKALEALAEGAAGERDFGRAVERWQARAAHDPYDSRVALRLMQALEADGNRAGALHHSGMHERLLQDEFGMEPAPEVLALAERLRRESAPRAKPLSAGGGEAGNAAARPSSDTTRAPSTDVSPAPPPPVAAAPAPRQASPSVRNGVAALLLGAAFSLVLWLGLTRKHGPAPSPPEPSIAVLPIANHSTDRADAVLAGGMTEDLIAMIARTTGLRVIAATSAFSYRGRHVDVRSVADSLGVAYLLESALQKNGSRLRVQVRLMAGRDGSTRWSETYDRELRDVFTVQDDIARSVARELGLRLGATRHTPLRRQPTQNVAAYELYLRGSDRTLVRSDSGARAALDYFRQAIALDSMYAAAWAGMGKMYSRAAGAMPMPVRARYFALADEAAQRAVALDDSLAEAHAALGVTRMVFFDFTSAERHLARAIALDPNGARTHEWMGTLYLWTGRPTEALAHAERALELDPLSPSAHAEVAQALLGNDRCDEALRELDRLSRLRPPLVRAVFVAAQCYARKQRWPEAVAALRPLAERGEQSALGQLGYIRARAGQREDALRIRATLLERWRRGDGSAFDVAVVYAGLGEVDQAIAWLDRSITDRSLVGSLNPAHGMIMGPLFEDLRRDRRFERLRARLGLQKR
jgi:DNA-binding SARP family transcriptional activator/TolB-like protein